MSRLISVDEVYFCVFTDVVHLSNSGPVIKGSEIVFKAEVLDGTSHPVQDEKYFEYHWLNTADFFTVSVPRTFPLGNSKTY